tara:strand:- start:1933 stop:2907 length:975 start_codon:yes stop_codon:yes gene_type:complete
VFSGCVTDVEGFRLGHSSDLNAYTGVSVILCPQGTVGSCELRGTATATRGIDALRAEHLVGHIDALVFTGGSAYGLASSDGVMRYLEEQGIGFKAGSHTVPTVASSVLFDLNFGDGKVRPSSEMGYDACVNSSLEEGAQGSVGAGTGATVAKLLGKKGAMKGGLGTASCPLPSGGTVGALAVVNAYGSIYDYASNLKIASPLSDQKNKEFVDTEEFLRLHGRPTEGFGTTVENTTLVAITTNVSLNKNETHKLSQMAAHGLILSVRPSYTTVDGDVVFALSKGNFQEALDVVGEAAKFAVGQAICRAIKEADGFSIIPSWKELN